MNDIKILDHSSRLEILEKLVHLIKRPGPGKPAKPRSLLDLKGLGKEIWQNINTAEYIDHERHSWDKAFEEMRARRDDELLDAESMGENEWDQNEWEW